LSKGITARDHQDGDDAVQHGIEDLQRHGRGELHLT
jgi:hypothetical protein